MAISKQLQDQIVSWAMIAAIGYLFTGIGEGKHERDVSNTKQEMLMGSDEKIWGYIDEDLRWKYTMEIRHSEEQVKNAEKWADHYHDLWQQSCNQ